MSTNVEKKANTSQRAFVRATQNIKKTQSNGTKGQNNKFQAMLKKYPNLSSRILYVLIAAMTFGGMYAYHKHSNDKDNDNADKIETVITESEEQELTYAKYMERLKPLEPMIIADLIAKEGVHIGPKSGLHTPYQDSRGYWTIGFGSRILKDGTVVTSKTKPITAEEAYELARWHLENETFLLMYWYDVGCENVNINTTEEAFAIASVMYNSYANLVETPSKKNKNGKYAFRNVNYDERSARLRKDFEQYGVMLPESVVLDRFAQYPITHMESFGQAWLDGESKETIANKFGNFLLGGRGIRWRRWLEAEMFLGHVTPEMMLNCPVGGMYEFFKYVGSDRENWFLGDGKNNRRVNDKTFYMFQEWIRAPRQKSGASLAGWKKAKDLLPQVAREMCEQGKCTLGNLNAVVVFEEPVAQNVKKQTYVTEYKEQYADVISEFRQGSYAVAATKLEDMIALYPKNALLRNDLAVAYNKLGRYDDAIATLRVIFDTIGDTEQYGAAYYNAGQAREGLGQLESALANYKLAVRHGNKRVQNDVKRMEKNVKSSAKQKSGDKNNNMKKKQNNRRATFKAVTKNIRNNAHSTDFDLNLLIRSGKDII